MASDLRVPADVLAVDDEAELCMQVIEPARSAVGSGDGTGPLDVLRQLTSGQRALLAVQWCVSETLKGGFEQFFSAPIGELAYDARVGFERIGVPEGAMILIAAHALLSARPEEHDPRDPDFDEAEEAERMDAYLATYEPLHERFYALVDRDLYPRAAAYVRAHPDEFIR
jgi:hypothetical protein